MNGIMAHASGEITITQDRLNKLLAEFWNDNVAITCICEDGNNLGIIIRSKIQGTVHLRLRLLEAKHDMVASIVKFQLLDRRLEGHPLKELLFQKMPDAAMNFLLNLFALPQNIKVANVGDIYTVDLRGWLLQSQLGKNEIMGERVLDCIAISGVAIEEGRIIVKGNVDTASGNATYATPKHIGPIKGDMCV